VNDTTTSYKESKQTSTPRRERKIKMKDDKPIKQRYYPKNPKIQGEIIAKVDESHTAPPS